MEKGLRTVSVTIHKVLNLVNKIQKSSKITPTQILDKIMLLISVQKVDI